MSEAGKARAWPWVSALTLLAALAVAVWWHAHGGHWLAPPRLIVHGGDGGGLPRATPAQEGFDAAALAGALALARESGMHAFLVSRHGHVVLAEYANGFDAQSSADAGGFAGGALALAAGAAFAAGLIDTVPTAEFEPARLAAAIESAAQIPYPEYLARAVWQPINAADAAIELPAPGARAPADCCLVARVSDWLRIAGLLLDGGRFQGTQVASPEWVQRIAAAGDARRERGWGVWLAASARGAEPFAADGVFYLKGPGRWRLWMAPTLSVAVLFAADGAEAGWDETRLPNRVFRAIIPRATPATDPALGDLVPGH
ncbi:MAG: hypothetical protein IT480_11535 [Gammaproteobacteria bacterium]|nr:hypothetical protein [Gammaproteobacteria bacterium]